MTHNSAYSSSRSSRRDARPDLRIESPTHLAGAALILWLAGVLVHSLALLVPVAVTLLVAAGVAYLVRPRSQTMYWRGRQIDLDSPPGPAQRLYRCLFRR